MGAYVYIFQCSDGKYYVGSTRGELQRRVDEHNQGVYPGFTKSRLPVELVYSNYFDRITDAVAMERRVKGWRREKKEGLINGEYDQLPKLVRTAKKK